MHKPKRKFNRGALSLLTLALLLGLTVVAVLAALPKNDLPGPAGSGQFATVVTLPNGNFVAIDPYYDAPGPIADVGAVYLYDRSGTLISTLTGSTAGDEVGATGGYFVTPAVDVLPSGDFVIISSVWDNGAVADVGAVTWCSGTTGCSGTVSAANSLVGATADDQVGVEENGNKRLTVLPNGNYVVGSPLWDDGATADVGAVTWCDGTTGCTGAVSAANSLVGATADDQVGVQNVIVLTNGNYVVSNNEWDNGAATNAGAVTWCDGTAGCTGAISAANSLVGSTDYDVVGSSYQVIALANGNYAVGSPFWDDGATDDVGAVTWCDGTAGCTGAVSAASSLTGSTADDGVGSRMLALTNGNYVVRSFEWDDGATADVGAATWCDGTSGCTGVVSAANSLIGSTADDQVSRGDVTALNNGHYVVGSSKWDDGATADVGAATWCDGTSGCTGAVSAANSLVGSTENDWVGGYLKVVALANGHYVVGSDSWDDGATEDVGAATWCDGASGCMGTISAANSLVGSTADDEVGGQKDVFELANGHYVVRSHHWDDGATVNVGAITWCDGTAGCTGAVSAANSLVGSTAGDQVGGGGLLALTNGNYIVGSDYWDDGATANVGAATWCDGTSGCTGAVSAANSLVGSTAEDKVGNTNLSNQAGWALTNGNYVVGSPNWDDGATQNVGAATWCDGASGCTGAVSAANSLVGATENETVGNFGRFTALPDGSYTLVTSRWYNGATKNAGAATWCDGASGCTGPITADNSVLGTNENTGYDMHVVHDPTNNQLVVGRPGDNIVTLVGLPGSTPSVELALSKAVDPVAAAPGEEITYTIAFSNTSEIVATDVVITDTLSADLLAASYTSSGVTLTEVPGSRYVWTAPDLAEGEGAVIMITATLAEPLAAGTLSNEVTIAVSGTVKTVSVDLTVADVAPIADAGADQKVLIDSTVTLDGSGSADSNGDTLTYAWVQTAGPTVTLSDPTAAQPTFTAPDSDAELTFSLTVNDGTQDSTPDEVVITVSETVAYYFYLPIIVYDLP